MMRRMTGLGLAMLVATGISWGDTLYLKNGKLLRGQIVQENAESVMLETGSEWLRIPNADIESSRKDAESSVSRAAASRKADKGSPIGRGSIMLGGSMSIARAEYTYPSNQKDSSDFTSITPLFGYFVADGLMVGPAINAMISNSYGSRQVVTGLGIDTAYYFGGARSKLYPRVGLNFMATNSTRNGESIYSGNRLTPNIGLDIMLSRRTAISVQIDYSMSSFSYSSGYMGADHSNTLSATFGVRVFAY